MQCSFKISQQFHTVLLLDLLDGLRVRFNQNYLHYLMDYWLEPASPDPQTEAK